MYARVCVCVRARARSRVQRMCGGRDSWGVHTNNMGPTISKESEHITLLRQPFDLLLADTTRYKRGFELVESQQACKQTLAT